MSRKPPPQLVAPLLALALLAGGCSGGPDPGRPIETLELIDFTAAGMFKQMSVQLQRPYVLELPLVTDPTRHDLRLSDTTERAVLEELVRLDPSLTFTMEGPAWIVWPAGEEGQNSNYAKRVERFASEGGAFSVLKDLAKEALPPDTRLSMAQSGQARPVSVNRKNATVREILAEIAAQAQLSIVCETGYVRVNVVPE